MSGVSVKGFDKAVVEEVNALEKELEASPTTP